MPSISRRALVSACAMIIVLVFPATALFPQTLIISVAAIAAVLYLWFAKMYAPLALAMIASLAAIVSFGGIDRGINILVGMMVPSLIMSQILRKGNGMGTAVALGTLFTLLAIVVNFNAFVDVMNLTSQTLKDSAANPQLAQLYSPADYAVFVEYINWLADKIFYFLPAMVLCLLTLLFSIGIILGNSLVRISGIYSRPLTHFVLWKLPEWVLIPTGLAAIMVLLDQQVLSIIGWNILIFLFIVYSLFGMSFIEYQMRVRQFHLPLKIIVYLFIFLAQIVSAVALPLIALFDAKFDFRKIRAKQLG